MLLYSHKGHRPYIPQFFQLHIVACYPVNASACILQDGTFATKKKYTMKKLTKKFAAAMFICSLSMATPLLAQNETNNGTTQSAGRNNNDDSGKWGLLGLVGLLGLLGLRKKDNYDRTRTTTRNP
jgi:MYXO-CTERM domain-containing protein